MNLKWTCEQCNHIFNMPPGETPRCRKNLATKDCTVEQIDFFPAKIPTVKKATSGKSD